MTERAHAARENAAPAQRASGPADMRAPPPGPATTLRPIAEASAPARRQRDIQRRARQAPTVQRLATLAELASRRPSTVSGPAIQREPIETAISGLTHLVKMVGGSIYDGDEEREVDHGTELLIETDDRILSRRGPNQEIYGAQDRLGEQVYAWVRVLMVGDEKAPAGLYVREDTLATGPVGPTGVEEAEKRERLSDVAPLITMRPESVWFTSQDVVDAYTPRKQKYEREASGKSVAWPDIKTKSVTNFLKRLAQDDFVERDTSGNSRLLEGCLAELRRQNAEEIDEPYSFGNLMRQAIFDVVMTSVSELVDTQVEETSAYRDWLHDIATLMTMLAERSDLPTSAVVKLLKFALMRNQLQAPLDETVVALTSRQVSPLTSEDYARGMRTRLWTVATDTQMSALAETLVGMKGIKADPQNKKTYKKDLRIEQTYVRNFNKAYYVVATPAPFDFETKQPVTLHDVPPDLAEAPRFCFLAPLRLQLFPVTAFTGSQSDISGRVSSHMGAHGQRASLSESAEIVALALAGMLRAGKVSEALQALEGGFRKSVAKSKSPLSEIQYDSRMLLAPAEQDPKTGRWRDPLLTSTTSQVEAMDKAYRRLVPTLKESAGLSPVLWTNFRVFANLVGGSAAEFFGNDTPARVTATITDTLERLYDLALRYAFLSDTPNIVGRKLVLEQFYEQMQALHEAVRFKLSWSGADPGLLHEGIRSMLPMPEVVGAAPTSTHAAPYGLAMINQVNTALGDHKNVGVLKSSYYETPGLFEGHESVEDVEQPRLLELDLIVMEPHPNNAEERDVQAHDPIKLLRYLASEPKQRTVLMDVTLNHLGEEEIARVLEVAAPYIKDGWLNLVLMQSATKFLQHGMDIVSLGIAAVFNAGKNWVTFNKNMRETDQAVPDDDALYLGRMMTTNKPELGDYLDRIRVNTAFLKHLLLKELGSGKKAIEVTTSTDNVTVYVAIAPTSALVAKIGVGGSSGDRAASAMKQVYQLILTQMAALGLATRSSFGFNLTNLGECITTIRITSGIEDPEYFVAYAKGVGEVNTELALRLD